MQADMRDVAFYFKNKNKKGITKVTGSGLADIVLGGSGLTVGTCLIGSTVIVLTIVLGYRTPRLRRQRQDLRLQGQERQCQG